MSLIISFLPMRNCALVHASVAGYLHVTSVHVANLPALSKWLLMNITDILNACTSVHLSLFHHVHSLNASFWSSYRVDSESIEEIANERAPLIT